MSRRRIKGAHDGTDWWERSRDRLARWADRHPVAARRVLLARAILQWAALAGIALLAALVPTFLGTIVQWVALLLPLAVLVLLARTATVGWGLLSLLYAVAIALALPIALAVTALADAIGLSFVADGLSVGISPFLEEVGKLLPIALLAITSPRFTRGLAVVDWLLLGYACGLGFTAVEQGVGYLVQYQESFAAVYALIDGRDLFPPFEPIPFLAGGEVGGAGNYAAGHAVYSALIAGSVGLGIALWRRAGDVRRVAAIAIPLIVSLVIVSHHLVGNALVTRPFPEVLELDGFPDPWAFVWLATGGGWANPVLLAVLLLVAASWDARARSEAQLAGRPVLDPVAERRSRRVDGWARGRLVLAGPALAAVQAWSDLVAVLHGFRHRPGETRADALRRGRVVRARRRRARSLAVQPVHSPSARRRFRWSSAAVFLAAAAAAAAASVSVASAIGLYLLVPGGAPNGSLASILHVLAEGWESLSPQQQLVLGIVAPLLLIALGAAPGAAFWGFGVATWLLEHRGGVQRTLEVGAARALQEHLVRNGPGDLLVDGVELLATFAPIRLIGDGTIAGEAVDSTAVSGATAVIDRFVDSNGSPVPSWNSESASPPPVREMHPLDPGGVPVTGRADLHPWTRYVTANGQSYYTDGSARLAFVDNATESVYSTEVGAGARDVVFRNPDGTAIIVEADGSTRFVLSP